MKLSEHTTSVLKNFATINQNLVIKEGSELLTMSSMKNIVARAEVEETFPKEIAIYDLNEFLIKHPAATFYVYAKGDSMINAGIYDGDLLIVDRSLNAELKSIVIAVIDGEFTVKRVNRINNTLYLIPDNSLYKPIKITKEMNFEIWGVVTHTIHKPK